MDLLFEAEGKLSLKQGGIGRRRNEVHAEWTVSARPHRVDFLSDRSGVYRTMPRMP